MDEDFFPDDLTLTEESGMGDYVRLMALYEEVEQEIEELRQHEYKAADSEGDYRMLVTEKTAAERMRGTPVTVIGSLVKGDAEVVRAFLDMEKAKADAKASSHLIFLKKDQMSMLAEVIKHEWYRPSNG